MNPIQGKKILITGGAGFVGSTTADQLLEAGAAEVRMLDNFVRGNLRNLERAKTLGDVVVIEGDIRDADTVDSATDGVDYVFHQAALRITRCAEAPREAVEVLDRWHVECARERGAAQREEDRRGLFSLGLRRSFLSSDG